LSGTTPRSAVGVAANKCGPGHRSLSFGESRLVSIATVGAAATRECFMAVGHVRNRSRSRVSPPGIDRVAGVAVPAARLHTSEITVGASMGATGVSCLRASIRVVGFDDPALMARALRVAVAAASASSHADHVPVERPPHACGGPHPLRASVGLSSFRASAPGG
jgi:hypothetical protein